MSSFEIITDSAADLDAALIKQMNIQVLPLSFTIEEKTYHDYPDQHEMPLCAFYEKIRRGSMATTAAVNVLEFTQALEPLLEQGKDVLILALSSGLSMTYNASAMAVAELAAKYPQRKLYTVDTLCASAGQGLLVYLAACARAAGKDIDQVRDWVVSHKLNVCHYLTVDDLNHLKRGGRISATTALVGSMLQMKPLIHMNNDGCLTSIGKTRGRQASLRALVEKIEQIAIDPADQTLFITHSDAQGDAELVAQMAKDRLGIANVHISSIGPVIGTHVGPAGIVIAFMGIER